MAPLYVRIAHLVTRAPFFQSSADRSRFADEILDLLLRLE